MRLNPASPRGEEWGRLLQAAGSDVRLGTKPWRIYRIDPAARQNRMHGIPALPGPMIYAVLEWGGWCYVGQTRRPLIERLKGHLRTIDRAIRWHTVTAMLLEPDVDAARIDELERAGRDVLKPLTGSRWPAA